MPRKVREQRMPGEACQKAFQQAIDTAMICAAALWGEKPMEDPNDASGRVLMVWTAMVYFLFRLDPKVIHDLYFSENGFADANYKPFPPGYWLKKGIFAKWFTS